MFETVSVFKLLCLIIIYLVFYTYYIMISEAAFHELFFRGALKIELHNYFVISLDCWRKINHLSIPLPPPRQISSTYICHMIIVTINE